MDLVAFTIFFCQKHNKFILVENIYKTIPNNYFQNLDNCENNDIINIGYITFNNGSITGDMSIEKISYNINYDIVSSSNKDEIVKYIISWLNTKFNKIIIMDDIHF